MDFSYNLPLLLGKHVKLLRGRLCLVLDPLYVVLSLQAWWSLIKASGSVQSAFGIVKLSGVTPINPGESRPPP
ncbi:unnamed protein product [Prunus brigantina]